MGESRTIFFRSLKHEPLNDETLLSVIDYVAFYNGKRSRSTLGYQSLFEFEREYFKHAA